jgi:hypothetical protein
MDRLAKKAMDQKAAFLEKIIALYRAMNMADSDNPERQTWMAGSMAGHNGCAHLDAMIRGMVECGALSGAEAQALYDQL